MLDTGIQNLGQSARLYSHCAKPGGSGSVVVFGFNMGQNMTRFSIGKMQQIEEYVVRPENNNLQSQSVQLNNNVLRLVDGKIMPKFNPRIVVGDNILMERGTIGFWVLPKADNKKC